MTRLGYARVSTTDQDTELQIRELHAAGCERIYRDHGVSGTKTSRPELDKMLDRLSLGDEVVVWKLDRLGRNTRHLLELLHGFIDHGINFRSLRDGIATDPDSEPGSAMARAMVTIMSAFAQLERDQLSERTRAGMAVAASHGRKAGRQEITAGTDLDALRAVVPEPLQITEPIVKYEFIRMPDSMFQYQNRYSLVNSENKSKTVVIRAYRQVDIDELSYGYSFFVIR